MNDLTGKQFNRWSVLNFDGYRKRHYYWKCQCSCGTIKIIEQNQLKNGNSKSCGCLRKETLHKLFFKDLTGQKFGKLSVINFHKYNNEQNYWNCLCDCGNFRINTTNSLIKNRVKSCGCLKSKPPGSSAFNTLFIAYRNRAKKNKRDFDFTQEEFKIITQQNCYYCGSQPSSEYKSKNGSYFYNGIDRINNTIGYTKENSVPCCKICNLMKLDYTLDEFYKHILKIIEYKRNNG